jgi:hypothetical protein
MTFGITKLSIKYIIEILSINDIQQNSTSDMLDVTMLNVPMLNVIMLNVMIYLLLC